MSIEKLGQSFLDSLFSKTKTVAQKLNDTIDVVNAATDGTETFDTVTATTAVVTNTVSERTAAAGIIVDGLLIKDGALQPTIGAVTQDTSIITDVTLNTPFGTITTVSFVFASSTGNGFILNNNTIKSTSMLIASIQYEGSSAVIISSIAMSTGAAYINLFNVGSGPTDSYAIISFQVIG